MNSEIARIPDGITVTLNGKALVFGDTILQLSDSNDIIGNPKALQTRLVEDGYLLLRDFHDREAILRSRSQILSILSDRGMLKQNTPVEDGIVSEQVGSSGFQFPHRDVLRLDSYRDIVNSDRTMDFFARLLGGPSLTFDHKWLRAAPPGYSSSAHCDVVYMGAGTKNLYTMWTAFGDISLELGPIAICLGSHQHKKLKATYGSSDAHQELLRGDFSRDPFDVMKVLGKKWGSTAFNAGDVLIFGMYLMHASLDNVADRFRISSDTRYQLASEPVDQRHMGETPDEIPKAPEETRISMREARAQWGLA